MNVRLVLIALHEHFIIHRRMRVVCTTAIPQRRLILLLLQFLDNLVDSNLLREAVVALLRLGCGIGIQWRGHRGRAWR